MSRRRSREMTHAWLMLGAARGALDIGDREAALRFLAAAARARRSAVARCDVVIGDGRATHAHRTPIRHVITLPSLARERLA